jgi:hypothetical protein
MGPFGGEGSIVAGDQCSIVGFSTSITTDLNNPSNVPKKATLIVDSPTSLVGGNVVVDPAKDETCASILEYLNNPMSQGKPYCNSTNVRGGWKSEPCEPGMKSDSKGTKPE